MRTATPDAPGATGELMPSRSPGFGTTPPDFATRAVITTRVARDNVFSGLIAIESSNSLIMRKHETHVC